MLKKQIIHPDIPKTEVVIRTVYEKDGVTKEVEETVLLPSRLFFDDDDNKKQESDVLKKTSKEI